jgi:hypothetical protein
MFFQKLFLFFSTDHITFLGKKKKSKIHKQAELFFFFFGIR